ncbi:hypothetical protein PsYK624_131220 [Phanerochaete sordida]|uniref:Uncharacterized protein n=1 Tax=Phanerochaete sordida TaxID=48140 RepID=A0A9P3GME9_9APHY|nr:hypothetical protein PsYK624_131220 [Phanerochaete sordida]
MNPESHTSSSAAPPPHVSNASRAQPRAGPSTAPRAHPPQSAHRAPHSRAHVPAPARCPPLVRSSPYPPIASSAWTDAASAIPPDELAFMDACFDFDGFEADNAAYHLRREA